MQSVDGNGLFWTNYHAKWANLARTAACTPWSSEMVNLWIPCHLLLCYFICFLNFTTQLLPKNPPGSKNCYFPSKLDTVRFFLFPCALKLKLRLTWSCNKLHFLRQVGSFLCVQHTKKGKLQYIGLKLWHHIFVSGSRALIQKPKGRFCLLQKTATLEFCFLLSYVIFTTF